MPVELGSYKAYVKVSDPGAPGKMDRLNFSFFWRRVHYFKAGIPSFGMTAQKITKDRFLWHMAHLSSCDEHAISSGAHIHHYKYSHSQFMFPNLYRFGGTNIISLPT